MTVTFTMTDLTSEAGRTVKVYRATVGDSHVSGVLARRNKTDDYVFGVAAVRDGELVADWYQVYEFPEDALSELSLWAEDFSGIEKQASALRAGAVRSKS